MADATRTPVTQSRLRVLAQKGFEDIKLLSEGKVRELYLYDPQNSNTGNESQTLLFVATDRISAYDVILSNGVPGKGALLTSLSQFWFRLFATRIPELKTHFITTGIPDPLKSQLPPDVIKEVDSRCMQVRPLEIVPIESIVRGYLTGSAWSEYRAHGTVHGIHLRAGYRESEKLDSPLWTPSTKAEQGMHDENVSPERGREIIGDTQRAAQIEDFSLRCYTLAAAHAAQRGIIVADTKFEFGVDSLTGEVALVDEVLTPDSSRFWPVDGYKVGKSQESFDKQYLRDWLIENGLKGKEGVSMPERVVMCTQQKYNEAWEKLSSPS